MRSVYQRLALGTHNSSIIVEGPTDRKASASSLVSGLAGT